MGALRARASGLARLEPPRVNYRDLLRLPQWQKRRLTRLEASGWACEQCRATERELQVHHKRYVRGRAPWEYEDDELEVLCDNCHAAEHGKAPRRAPTCPPVRSPADRLAWMLMLESDWWEHLSGEDQSTLRCLPGWHGHLFRFIDRTLLNNGAQPWADLRERLQAEHWSNAAISLVEGEDPAIEPLPDDLPRALEKLRGRS
jgi:hypothetical protein